MSKKSLINDILEYVFNAYGDNDAVIREFKDNYIKLEKQCKERREKRRNKIPTPKKETYVISNDVRCFLEPLVDAEYFKLSRYGDLDVPPVVIKAMKELNTDLYEEYE